MTTTNVRTATIATFGAAVLLGACGGGGSSDGVIGTFSGQEATADVELPADDNAIATAVYQDSRVRFEYPAYWEPQVDSDGSGVRFDTPNSNFCGLDITDVSGLPGISLEWLVTTYALPLAGPRSTVDYIPLNGSRAARVRGDLAAPDGPVPWTIQVVYRFDTNYTMSCHGEDGDSQAEFAVVLNSFRVDA